MSELDIVVNTPVTLTLSTGLEIVVTPIRVKELPAFIAAIQPLIAMADSGFDVVAMLAQNSDAVIAATAIGLRISRAQADEMGIDDLVESALSVIEVNADFFARRVQPALMRAQQTMAARLAGSTPSSNSSDTATTDAT